MDNAVSVKKGYQIESTLPFILGKLRSLFARKLGLSGTGIHYPRSGKVSPLRSGTCFARRSSLLAFIALNFDKSGQLLATGGLSFSY